MCGAATVSEADRLTIVTSRVRRLSSLMSAETRLNEHQRRGVSGHDVVESAFRRPEMEFNGLRADTSREAESVIQLASRAATGMHKRLHPRKVLLDKSVVRVRGGSVCVVGLRIYVKAARHTRPTQDKMRQSQPNPRSFQV